MRLLTERFAFRSSQCDRYGVWTPQDLLVCMQEMAGRHSEILHLSRPELLRHNAIWVLLRNAYRLYDTPAIGETVVASTFAGHPRRTLFPRYHRFAREDGSLLAVGAGSWTMADIHSHRMVLIPELQALIPDPGDLKPTLGHPPVVEEVLG